MGVKINVRKASGEEQPFKVEKLEGSLRSAGAKREDIREIVADISDWIYPGVETRKIYRRAFNLLKRLRRVTAARYKLKQAIFELGPTGYPFEHFLGKLFSRQGYDVEVGVHLEGKCVIHEMDVVAVKDHTRHLVECKYGRDQGKVVTVQTPLYVRARIDDIVDGYASEERYSGSRVNGWVITNTRFSADAISYGSCAGLNLMAWDYPHGNGLKETIERAGIYPLTVLTTLTVKEKQRLLDNGIVICSQLLDNLDALDEINLPRKKSTALVKELNDILHLGK